MKKSIFAFISLFVCASFTFASPVKGYMLQKEGPLYVKNTDGDMVWTQSLTQGTEIQIDNDQIISAKRVSGNKKLDGTFVKVIVKGQEFWTLTDRVKSNQTLAIVTAPTSLYRSADLADFYDYALTTGDVITKGENVTVNGKIALSQITYFDNNEYKQRTGYILNQNISIYKDDITAIVILDKINQAKDEKVKKELLKNINSLRLSPGVQTLFDSIRDELSNDDLSETGFDSVEAYMVVLNPETNSKVNVRSLPGIKGEVVGQFSEPAKTVYVTNKTKLKSKVGDSENFWYEVEAEEDGIKGWVFGDYISSL